MSFTETESRLGPIALALVIAVGVAVGIVLGGLALWRIAEHHVGEQAKQAQRVLSQQLKAAAESERRAEEARALAEAERVQARAAQQREDAAARSALAAEAARRDAAWKRFYRPSPGCVESSASVECANEHIRAKRAFEERYARGDL